uniref:Putative lipocalin-3 1 n=1 Tax=Amblyomma cajennense TaxID=34607 RepID=A0A023FRP8_AMBCJ
MEKRNTPSIFIVLLVVAMRSTAAADAEESAPANNADFNKFLASEDPVWTIESTARNPPTCRLDVIDRQNGRDALLHRYEKNMFPRGSRSGQRGVQSYDFIATFPTTDSMSLRYQANDAPYSHEKLELISRDGKCALISWKALRNAGSPLQKVEVTEEVRARNSAIDSEGNASCLNDLKQIMEEQHKGSQRRLLVYSPSCQKIHERRLSRPE